MVTHTLVCDRCERTILDGGKTAQALRDQARQRRLSLHIGRKDYCLRCVDKLFPVGPRKEPRA
jgi:hypothetical protein